MAILSAFPLPQREVTLPSISQIFPQATPPSRTQPPHYLIREQIDQASYSKPQGEYRVNEVGILEWVPYVQTLGLQRIQSCIEVQRDRNEHFLGVDSIVFEFQEYLFKLWYSSISRVSKNQLLIEAQFTLVGNFYSTLGIHAYCPGVHRLPYCTVR